MSVKWMSHIWEERIDLKGAELLCAVAIADHADADGFCYPGLKSIAAKLRCTVRNVQDLINRLEEKKVFKIERGDGRGNYSSFQFIKGEESCTVSEEKRVKVSAKKGEGLRKKRVKVSSPPLYKEESLLEPDIEPSDADASGELPLADDLPEDSEIAPQTIWDEFTVILAKQGILPDSARHKLAKLIKTFGNKKVVAAYYDCRAKLPETADAFAYLNGVLKNYKFEAAKPVEGSPEWYKQKAKEIEDKQIAAAKIVAREMGFGGGINANA